MVGWENNESEKMWKEAVMGSSHRLSQHLPGRTETDGATPHSQGQPQSLETKDKCDADP